VSLAALELELALVAVPLDCPAAAFDEEFEGALCDGALEPELELVFAELPLPDSDRKKLPGPSFPAVVRSDWDAAESFPLALGGKTAAAGTLRDMNSSF